MADQIKTRKPNIDEGWHRDFANSLAQTPVDKDAPWYDRKNNLAKGFRDRGVQEFNKLPEEVRNYEGLKAMKKGGKVSSASKRADGCATKGKTKGRMV